MHQSGEINVLGAFLQHQFFPGGVIFLPFIVPERRPRAWGQRMSLNVVKKEREKASVRRAETVRETRIAVN